jgi:hypothetical protein
MNERIRELAHKADFIIKKNNGDEWRWGHIDPELAEKLEKFAELIIRECAGLMDGRRIEYGNCKDGRVILKHFGVEEESW